jgi:tRNA-modifying protein YgfZ
MIPPDHPHALSALPFLAILRVAGADAASFLQGQLTSDVRLLGDGRTQVAAYNTPQGRVIGLLRLREARGAIHALLPGAIAPSLASLLKRFVLRAKVDLRLERELDVAWLRSDPSAAVVLPDDVIQFDYAPGRTVIAASRETLQGLVRGTHPVPDGTALPELPANDWNAADIAVGLPQVEAATSGQFVAQMLNLDRLDAISFTKGCYTGQEIVARTQHLGRIKRRTLRYRLAGGEPPAPLSGLVLEDRKVGEVLMSAHVGPAVEILAVTSLDARDRTLRTEDGREATPLPLPYPLGEADSG